MYEYVAFNPYNSNPEALAAELTKKSTEGWEVVDIVTTFDGRYCAFLRRQTTGAAVAAPTAMVEATTTGAAAPAAWYADPSKRYELQNSIVAVGGKLPASIFEYTVGKGGGWEECGAFANKSS